MTGPAPDDETGAPRQPEGLVRAIGVTGLAANAVNLTVGAGLFALPAAVAALLGPAAILAYLVCGVAVLLVFLCFAEAGSRVSRSGGAYAYVEAAFGPYAGFLVNLLLWFGFGILGDAAIANVLVNSVAALVPAAAAPLPRAAIMLLLFGGVALVNIRGVRQGVRLAIGVTVVKLLPLVLLVVAGVFAVRWDNLTFTSMPSAAELGAASHLLFFAFGGPATALTACGEVRNCARTVPRAILLAISVLLLLYIGLQAVAQGVLGEALATEQQAPLAAAAGVVLGPAGSVLLILCATFASFGSVAGDLLAMPRALFAAARDGFLPAAVARVHPRFRTPHVAITCYAAAGALFAITGAFRQLAAFASAVILVVYLAVCLATIELQRRAVRLVGEPFRLAGGPLIPLAGAGVVFWRLLQATQREVIGIGAGLLFASLFYGARRFRRPATAAAGKAA